MCGCVLWFGVAGWIDCVYRLISKPYPSTSHPFPCICTHRGGLAGWGGAGGG